MSIPCVYLNFHNDLQMLLSKRPEGNVLRYALARRASLKDIIESQGIPHTEIAQILLNNTELGFDFIPVGGENLDILTFSREISVFVSTLLRPKPIASLKFMVDINAGKLARNLRMIGLDTAMVPDIRLVDVGKLAAIQKRILITRNRELLKCNTVIHGQLLRSENHVKQLQETVERYNLKPHIKPFSRCITCNGDLKSVTKQVIDHKLEPLTRKYYNSFKQCLNCEKIYWQGSHHNKMGQLIAEVF